MAVKAATLAACENVFHLRSRINSMLGLLSHYRCYRLRRRLFFDLASAHRCGYFATDMRKFIVYPYVILQE